MPASTTHTFFSFKGNCCTSHVMHFTVHAEICKPLASFSTFGLRIRPNVKPRRPRQRLVHMIRVSQSAPFLRSVAIPIGFYNGFLINANGALQGPSLYRPRRGFQGVQRVKKQRVSQCSMSVTHFCFKPNRFSSGTPGRDLHRFDPCRLFFNKKHTHSPCIYRLAAAVLISVDLRIKTFPINA